MSAADGYNPMQRVRVGLTGLAVVLLIVMLVSVVFNAASDEQPVTPKPELGDMTQAQSAAANSSAAEDKKRGDPIAEIGVAPSSATTDANSSDAVKPPPVQPTLPQQEPQH